jgi:MerR family copper efflux transcriptional regulator
VQIGEAAKASGVSAKMIRHYEQIGLVPNAGRRGNTYRDYSNSDVHRLQFVRRARDLGFSIDRIRDLLRLWSDQERSNAEVKALALKHLAELETRITKMREMAQTLHGLAAACDGSGRPDCPILEQLNGTAQAIRYKLQKAS